MTELEKVLNNKEYIDSIAAKVAQISKADTFDQSTGLVWYDLSPIVQLMFPFKQLIPLISKLPRVKGNGGTGHNWKRITAINVNNVSVGVSEGNRGGGINVTLQNQSANYKTLGLEGNASWEARLAAQNLQPDALGNTIQATLRSVMIGEEQTLIGGNASTALGLTPTPTLTAAGTGSALTNVPYYVVCVALAHAAWIAGSLSNGIPGQITKTNTDGSIDVFGGGSAQPSAQATVTPTAGQKITASVTAVPNAVAYAWYFGTTTGATRLQAITQSNQVILSSAPSGTNQLITALQVNSAYQDNSTNGLVPDGILSQMYGSVFGAAPGTAMATSNNFPQVATGTLGLAQSGSITFTAATGNTGLTISGIAIAEFDAVLQAAYDKYKIGFDRILMGSSDIVSQLSPLMDQAAASNLFRVLLDETAQGRVIAGRRVTSYLNKFFGNTLDIEIHPYLPPGTVIFWSDRAPYELSGVANILEVHTRMDYTQIDWPPRTRRYEYGVYVDEVFAGYFMPAFAVLSNLNTPNGTVTI
jgi:hypothetical protein